MENEKRLIDGNYAVKLLRGKCVAKYPTTFLMGLLASATEIEQMPTVDAVEVLRCKDCKYWIDEDGKMIRSDGVYFARCNVHNYMIDGRHTGWCPTENSFCSYGERKDNG